MTPLRILHLGKYYPPVKGGIETVVETLCRRELARGEQTGALVLGRGWRTTHEVRDGVPVRRAGSVATVGAVSIAPTLPFWLARASADVLVLHEPNPMALAAYFLARPAVPLVVWCHSEVIRPHWQYRWLYRPFLEFALRRAVRIVVASPPMLEVPALRAHRDKCVVIPYGLEPRRRGQGSVDVERVTAISQDRTRPVVLFVGRLVAYKGVDVLLEAMMGLEAEAVIVGDGPLRSSLEARARELGVGSRVHFLGEVSGEELQAWYDACDVFVLPSVTRQEAFGMVQLEAMLAGRPVVSTALGTGTSWVNQHDQTGLVVPPRDVRALRRSLARLLASPDLRQRLGAGGRARVLEHFTSEQMCSTTCSLYRDISPGGASMAHEEAASIA